MKIEVLDKGWVRLVDMMGGDARIVEMARSTRPDARRVQTDEELLLEVIRDRHNAPIELGGEVHFEVYAPIMVRAQEFTYRHASKATASGRHTNQVDVYIPSIERLMAEGADERYVKLYQKSFIADCKVRVSQYLSDIEYHIPRELARGDLPYSHVYSRWNWKFNFQTWLHILEQRLHYKAQWETQEYARALWTILVEKLPVTAEIFRLTNPGLEYER